jgi:hypothetical protein
MVVGWSLFLEEMSIFLRKLRLEINRRYFEMAGV